MKKVVLCSILFLFFVVTVSATTLQVGLNIQLTFDPQVGEDLNVSLAQIPLINSEDPCLKDLNTKTGDIIKIERKENEGLVVYYRVVV